MGSMVDMAVRIRANRNPKGGPIDPAIDAKYGPVLFAAWKKLGVLADQFRPWLKALLDRFGSPEATKALNEVRIWRAPFEDTRRELQDEGFLPRSASPRRKSLVETARNSSLTRPPHHPPDSPGD